MGKHILPEDRTAPVHIYPTPSGFKFAMNRDKARRFHPPLSDANWKRFLEPKPNERTVQVKLSARKFLVNEDLDPAVRQAILSLLYGDRELPPCSTTP